MKFDSEIPHAMRIKYNSKIKIDYWDAKVLRKLQEHKATYKALPHFTAMNFALWLLRRY